MRTKMKIEQGFSLIELLIVVAIIMILAALAIPRFLQARITANEASAVSSIRTITNAQVMYKIQHPDYAPDLVTLGPAHADLLNSTLGNPPFQKSGYVFSTTGDDMNFTVNADPIHPGSTGVRTFCTTTPAYINFQPDGSACDPTSPSTPILQ